MKAHRIAQLFVCCLLAGHTWADDFSDSVRHTFIETAHYRLATSNDVSLFATADDSAGLSNGVPVELLEGNGSDEQQWELEVWDDDLYRIKMLTDPWFLRADAETDGWGDGDPVKIHSWMNWNSQMWQIHRLGDGLVGIEMGDTGYYLDTPALSAGTPLQISQWHGGDNQRWVLQLRANVQSPAIVKGTDGNLLVFFKQFSPTNGVQGLLYASDDDGESWTQRYVFDEQAVYGPTFFANESALYMMYIDTSDATKLQLKKSTDHGVSWSNHVLATYPYVISTSGGADMLVKDGILYYSFSDRGGTVDDTGWSSNFRLRVASASVASDLTSPANWIITDPLECPSDPAAPNTRKGWLEPNCMTGPDGRVWVIARVDQFELGSVAAVLKVSDDRTSLEFANQYPAPDNEPGFLDAPWAGASKFHFLYDEVSGKYLVLSNPFMGAPSANTSHLNARNVLALYESDNLKDFRLVKTLIDDDLLEDWSLSSWHTGFQYPAAVIDGSDLKFVSRTAYNGFWNQHDANLGTYHELENFRSYLSPDGEVAHYTFDLPNDSGKDTSKMRGTSADLYGAIYNAAGQFGGCLVFDGANDWAGLQNRVSPKFHQSEAVSFSAWIKKTSESGTVYSSAINDLNTGLCLKFVSGMLRMTGRSQAGDDLQVMDFSFPADSDWHHITAVWDFAGDAMRLWLDGAPQAGAGTVIFSGTVYLRSAPARQDSIGCFFTGRDFFAGAMDDIRFFSRDLNSWEIADLYNGKEYTQGELIAAESFDYPLGTVINAGDRLGDGIDGFAAAWQFEVNSGEIVSNLTFPGLASSGNALRLIRNDSGWLFRGLDEYLTEGTYYFSFLFRRDDSNNDGSENWRWLIKHAKSTPVGASTKIAAGSTSVELTSLIVTGDSAQAGTVPYLLSEPALMLLRFTIDDDGAETASMKWYHSSDALPSDDQQIVWDVNSAGEFSGGGGWQLILPANIPAMIIDEFRMGSSLSSVLPGGYSAWATGIGLVGPAWADADGDGILNLYEYGLDGDPLDAGKVGQPLFFSRDGDALKCIYPVRFDADGVLRYTLLTSTNLASGLWQTNAYTVAGTNVTGNTLNFVTNSVPASEPAGFVKLMIEED